MTYVWVVETDGKRRYVDDKYLNPCRSCGERISVCRQDNRCEEKQIVKDFMCIFCEDLGCEVCQQDNGCRFCGVEKSSQCHCDNDYESAVGK